MTVRECFIYGDTDLGHAIACAAHDMLIQRYGSERASRIWNSESKRSKRECYHALWLATWQALTDNGLEISVQIKD